MRSIIEDRIGDLLRFLKSFSREMLEMSYYGSGSMIFYILSCLLHLTSI